MSQKRPTTLSAAFVRTVNKPGRYGDGRGHGLSLLVSRRTNGRLSKRRNQRIHIDGRETNLGLGVYPVVTLSEARQKALKNRRSIEQGRNPQAPTVPTFSHATERMIELHSPKWKAGGRSAKIWRSSLQRFRRPLGRGVGVDKVTTAQALSVLAPIWHAKAETARKVRQRISAVMRWAIAQGYREDNPADERVVAALGRNTKPPVHHNALHHSQVKNAMSVIEASGSYWAAQAALRFLILTATRSGEVRNATWDEINTHQRTWSIPADAEACLAHQG